MITTSRYAPANMRRIARMLADAMGTAYIARGKKTMDELAQYARAQGETRVMVLEANELALAAVDEQGRWSWTGKLAVTE